MNHLLPRSRCRRTCLISGEALYVLAVTTGLRQGELLGLKWDDVDMEAGTLQVRRTLTTAKGGPALSAPKTKGSRRTVKLEKSALEKRGGCSFVGYCCQSPRLVARGIC
jgi:integrase